VVTARSVRAEVGRVAVAVSEVYGVPISSATDRHYRDTPGSLLLNIMGHLKLCELARECDDPDALPGIAQAELGAAIARTYELGPRRDVGQSISP
jgi:hypothetical protein